ncbi:MAG: S9 family peptidase [Actinomycetota bacterium]|uniref:S9 family peptidase n=1 Tax=Pseudonocardia sp. UM4_GMWB1 TaxID=2212989 RepID=UPI00307CEE16
MDEAAVAAGDKPGLTFTPPTELFADPERERRWRARVTGTTLGLPHSAARRPERSMLGSNRSGTHELWLWDREADSLVQATERESGTEHGALSADGEWLWWFNDTGGNEFGHWVRQPFDGGTAKAVAPEAGDGIASGLALGHGPRGAVAVFALAVREGIAVWRQFEGQPAEAIYRHEQDGMSGPIAPDGSRVAIRHSEHGDASTPGIRVLDVDSGDSVAEMRDEGKQLLPIGFAPAAGDPRLLVRHERRGRHELLLWNTDSGEQQELAIDLPGQVDGIWLDAETLAIRHTHHARVTLHLCRADGSDLREIGPSDGSVLDVERRPGGALEYSWTSSQKAPRVYRWSPSDGSQPLFPDSPDAPPDGAPASVEWVDGPGGPIPVLVVRPQNAPSTPGRTLFWLHPGPDLDDADVYSPRLAVWADAGWTVIATNYRGSTGYGAAWRQAIVGRPGLTELEDLAAVHGWALSQGLADPQSCLLAGSSWGGYLTLLALGLQPERWRGGIGVVPVTDHAMSYELGQEPLRAMARALFGGSPEEVPERYAAASPLAVAEHVRAPVAIIAGENDTRIPIQQVDAYADKLSSLGRAPAVYRFGGGHGSQVSGTLEEFLLISVSFAEAVMAVAPGAPTPDTGLQPR